MSTVDAKRQVQAHWEGEVCGSRYGDPAEDRRRYFDEIERTRYQLDWMIPPFAGFAQARGKRVLEVGLGMGTDFVQWLRAGAEAYGRDLTAASVALVQERVALEGFSADVARGDAEHLAEFPDDHFDLYYSWGVLHHSPDTAKAIREAHRVLRPGGEMRIMIYNARSVTTWLVWLAQGPLRLRAIGPRTAAARYLESPGTKVYTEDEAHALVQACFPGGTVTTRTVLSAYDLLEHQRSARYEGGLWRAATALFPRRLVRAVFGDRFGLNLLITAAKA